MKLIPEKWWFRRMFGIFLVGFFMFDAGKRGLSWINFIILCILTLIGGYMYYQKEYDETYTIT